MPTTTQESVAVYVCEDCGFQFDADDGTCCEACNSWYCDGCRCTCCDDDEDDDGRDSRVYPWDYRPAVFRPQGDYPAEALLGVELEVGGSQYRIADVVEHIDEFWDHLYMKQDGSIEGVEIVTHPMTLRWARTYPFGDLLRDLRRNADCWLNDEYGMHIHVSRNAFQRDGNQSASHQMVWLLFMYRNVVELETLARRRSEQWAAFRQPAPGELARKAKDDICGDTRYVAVNCNNAKTFELRFFRATLNEQEFWAAIEFADASVRYTREITMRDVLRGKALTWRHFTAWVKKHNYRHLAAELAR